MTEELQKAIRHIKTRADGWAVKILVDALLDISERIERDDLIKRSEFETHLYENYCVPVSKIGKPNQYSSGCFYKDVIKCLDDLKGEI